MVSVSDSSWNSSLILLQVQACQRKPLICVPALMRPEWWPACPAAAFRFLV